MLRRDRFQYPRENRKPAHRGNTSWENVTDSAQWAREYFTQMERAFAKARLSIPKDGKVLEVGFGEGRLLTLMQEKGLDVVGTDARPRHTEVLPVAAARTEALPFADNTFAMVVSVLTIDQRFYEQDSYKMLDEIRRVLIPGGYYLAREPHFNKTLQPFGMERVVKGARVGSEFSLYRKP